MFVEYFKIFNFRKVEIICLNTKINYAVINMFIYVHFH